MNEARKVRCTRLGQELPGLDAPPFPGELGQRIYDRVSKRAYELWQERATALLRERGWSMGHPAHRKELLKEMEAFLFAPAAPAASALPAEGTVLCVKFGKPMPALKAPPFGGALGQRIFESVSAPAWDLWEKHATILMNHHGLTMADPEHRKFLMQQMEDFFFGEGALLPEGWAPPAAAGKGGGGKGAPAARQK